MSEGSLFQLLTIAVSLGGSGVIVAWTVRGLLGKLETKIAAQGASQSEKLSSMQNSMVTNLGAIRADMAKLPADVMREARAEIEKSETRHLSAYHQTGPMPIPGSDR